MRRDTVLCINLSITTICNEKERKKKSIKKTLWRHMLKFIVISFIRNLYKQKKKFSPSNYSRLELVHNESVIGSNVYCTVNFIITVDK